MSNAARKVRKSSNQDQLFKLNMDVTINRAILTEAKQELAVLKQDQEKLAGGINAILEVLFQIAPEETRKVLDSYAKEETKTGATTEQADGATGSLESYPGQTE